MIGLEGGTRTPPLRSAPFFLGVALLAMPPFGVPAGVASAQHVFRAMGEDGACVEFAAAPVNPALACSSSGGETARGLEGAAPRLEESTVELDRFAVGRRALEALERHREAGRVTDSLIAVATLRESIPELTDRWDLIEGEVLAGERRGCDAYARAVASPVSSVAARARVGWTRCLLSVRDRRASEALRALLARYPELPEALSLKLIEGALREERRDYGGAIAVYREIDLVDPGAPEAVQARARLAALEAAGHRVRPLSMLQRVERAHRLVRWGPPELARREVEELRTLRLPVPQQAAVALLAARLARQEGRFEDADRILREVRGRGVGPGVEGDPRSAAVRDLTQAAAPWNVQQVGATLRRYARSSRALATIGTRRILAYLRLAARAGLREESDRAIDALEARSLPCGVRLEAATLATAVADDARILALLEDCAERSSDIGVAARYHRARALERIGSLDEARREFERVIATDRSETRWYAFWARQRLVALDGDATGGRGGVPAVTLGASSEVHLDEGTAAPWASREAEEASRGDVDETNGRAVMVGIGGDELEEKLDAPVEVERLVVPRGLSAADRTSALGEAIVPVARTERGKVGESMRRSLSERWPFTPTEGAVLASREAGIPTPATVAEEREPEDGPDDGPELPVVRWQPLPREELERRLAQISERYGEAFPWFPRALAAVRLGRDDLATEELHEAYHAWYQARGGRPLRAGLEAVYRGATPPRIRIPSLAVGRVRRSLPAEARRELGVISASLGDHGLGVRWGGPAHAALRPRPYEDIVIEVARDRGLDPNLLFAVMRVESVYNPRVVSYAGAIGLLQIMPRTGRLIARSMGRRDFGIDDLLDPRTNIEMGAWYLASLIRRFEGCVPLAIAAYNGGPHNVRHWLREHSTSMPLDAFLERIPFEQTHRYVRRVLAHWTAYRAQQGLPMPVIDPTIPELAPDRVGF